MDKEILTFGDIEIKNYYRQKYYRYKSPIFLKKRRRY